MTNNQNTEQLEPCPFCNGEGVVLNCTSSTAKWKEVKCKECEANARLDVWNTRATPEAREDADLVEKLVSILDGDKEKTYWRTARKILSIIRPTFDLAKLKQVRGVFELLIDTFKYKDDEFFTCPYPRWKRTIDNSRSALAILDQIIAGK